MNTFETYFYMKCVGYAIAIILFILGKKNIFNYKK
jgi:hypothetical protein